MTLRRSIRRALRWILLGEIDYGHTMPSVNGHFEWRFGRRCVICMRHEEDGNFEQACPRVRPNTTELA